MMVIWVLLFCCYLFNYLLLPVSVQTPPPGMACNARQIRWAAAW